MEVPKFCQNCGAPLTGGVKFCESCGQPVGGAPAEPVQSAAPAPSVPVADPFTKTQPSASQGPAMQGPPGYQPPAASAYPEPPRVSPAVNYPPPPPPPPQYQQAPGYPPPVAGGVPPAQAKKSKTGCWIGGGCAVLLLIGLIVAFVAWKAIQSASEESGLIEAVRTVAVEVDSGDFEVPSVDTSDEVTTEEVTPEEVAPEEVTVDEEITVSEASDYLPAGALLYSDDFSDSESGWDYWQAEESSIWYEGERYHVQVDKVDWMAWGNPYQSFEDCVVEVEASYVDGPEDNDYGMILRYMDNDNFYRYEISTDGYYRFDLMQDNAWTSLIEWTESSLINTGDATNVMAAVCDGNTFTFYINGVEVDSYTDDNYPSGDVGLTAGTLEETGVHIAFDNIKVWEVQ
ncbi:MAG: zinc-ribbon domain-containing protein [Anaerolineae bacterium]